VTLLLGIKTTRNKILICAPSNTGIDEIVRRIIPGISTPTGNMRKVKVLRICSSEADPTEDILPYTLNRLAKLHKDRYSKFTMKDLPLLQEQLKHIESLKQEFENSKKEGITFKCIELLAEFDRHHPDMKNLNDKIKYLSEESLKIQSNIEGIKISSLSGNKGIKAYEQKILNDAEIICTTLSTSGIELLNGMKFDYLIIDEACQVFLKLIKSIVH